MGLHLYTEQQNNQALIAVYGAITSRSAAQLEAAVEHFKKRGCTVINVEIRSGLHDSSLVQTAEQVALSPMDQEEIAIR